MLAIGIVKGLIAGVDGIALGRELPSICGRAPMMLRPAEVSQSSIEAERFAGSTDSVVVSDYVVFPEEVQD
jgi:hypothetical protein